jgi:hypothetical protein
MKYAIEMGSGAMVYMPSLIKIGSGFQKLMPITVTARSKSCLLSLERWDHGFESHSKHGYLCAFILCLGSGLATG